MRRSRQARAVSSHGLPDPVRRLLRQPLRTGAIVLLAATAVAAAGIQSAAATALQATLDENWRGTYDILVTPSDALQPIDGRLPPNTLGSSADGMTLDDLAAVRAVDGVEVAAPIGEILVPGLRFAQAQVAIPRGFVGAGEQPQAYRVTATYTTDDGLGERVVESKTMNVVVDEATGTRPKTDITECLEGEHIFQGRKGDYTVDPEKYPALMRWVCAWRQAGDGVTLIDGPSTSDNRDRPWSPRESVLSFSLPSAPQSVTRVTLVDPEAERALLGGAGGFLDGLIDADGGPVTSVDDMVAWAQRSGDEFATDFLDELTRNEQGSAAQWDDAVLADMRRLFADNDDDWDEFVREGRADMRYAPLLIAQAPIAPLTLKIDVEAFGDAPATPNEWGGDTYALPAALDDGSPGTPVGTAAGDVSGLLNPFSASAPLLVWPGADLATAEALPDWSGESILTVGSVGAGSYEVGDTGVVLGPVGYSRPVLENTGPEALFDLGADPTELGTETAYSGMRQEWLPASGMPSVVVPVGTFNLDELAIDESQADYVPLGSYAPVSSTITAGEHAGTTMQPSLSGLGIVSARTAAIGSVHSAALWEDDTPISSIRVRVAGIDAYTPDGQARVIEVARAIEKLGFTASIVAGSSPTDTDVSVTGYTFGTSDPGGTQTVGELGTVTQRWSELGAAARVSLSVSTATLTVLSIALAASILLLGAVQVAGVPARREQAVVMREVGFTRARIARWFGAEELPGLVVVVGAGVIALWVSGFSGIAAVATIVAVGSVLVAAIAAVHAGSRVLGTQRPRDGRSRRLGARSVTGFGARQAVVHPLSTVTHVLAITIVGLAAAGLVAALIAGQLAAGESSLALLTITRQLWPQALLGATGVLGGILLTRLTRRIDLARRGEQWATLRAAGWTGGQLATAQRIEGITITLPALALTAALAWLGAEWLELAPQRYAGIALIAAAVAALLSFTVRRKGTT